VESATIFVYGTLKRGCRNHSVLRLAEFVGEAWTEPGYRMVNCGTYPGLVRAGRVQAEMAERVFGELYRVDAALLQALDRFEDAPNEYVRMAIRLSDGGEAQAYLYRGETAHLPACGAVWREETGS
jgi:gamma-glutamylaminecyclotransferase